MFQPLEVQQPQILQCFVYPGLSVQAAGHFNLRSHPLHCALCLFGSQNRTNIYVDGTFDVVGLRGFLLNLS
jgi:hypothetical protein